MPDLLQWLRDTTDGWTPEAFGLLVHTAALDAGVQAADFDELVAQLLAADALVQLPTESAALANVLEQALLAKLHEQLDALAAQGHDVQRATAGDRHYPDLEVSGTYFAAGNGAEIHAVDIKVARTKPRAHDRRPRTKTQKRPTLYTGNTYFLHPDLTMPGAVRPFDDYATHLDIFVLYDHYRDRTPPIENVEVVVHPAWQIASRKRSSTTREYIGAVDSLEGLRNGEGEFDTEQEFYTFWRRTYRGFRTSQAVTDVLMRERERAQQNE